MPCIPDSLSCIISCCFGGPAPSHCNCGYLLYTDRHMQWSRAEDEKASVIAIVITWSTPMDVCSAQTAVEQGGRHTGTSLQLSLLGVYGWTYAVGQGLLSYALAFAPAPPPTHPRSRRPQPHTPLQQTFGLVFYRGPLPVGVSYHTHHPDTNPKAQTLDSFGPPPALSQRAASS